MKIFMMIGLVVAIAFMPTKSQAHTEKPILYAIAFHADWCSSCKLLGPKVIKARGKSDLDSQNVLFIKLDLTDKTSRHQSSLVASAIGITDFYQSNAGKTGFVLLVNSATGVTLGKLTKDMDADQISSEIQKQIKGLQ